jgi:hypothetical protein
MIADKGTNESINVRTIQSNAENKNDELNKKRKPHRKESFVFDKQTKDILSKQYSKAMEYFKNLPWNLKDKNTETNGNIDLVIKGLNKFSRDDQPVALDRFTSVKDAQKNINEFYGKKLLFKGQSLKVYKGAANSVIANKVNKGNEYNVLNLTTDDGSVELIIIGEGNYYGKEEEIGTTISGWPIGIGTKGQIILLNDRKI